MKDFYKKIITKELFTQMYHTDGLTLDLMDLVPNDTLFDFIKYKIKEDYSIQSFISFKDKYSYSSLNRFNDFELANIISLVYDIDINAATNEINTYNKDNDLEDLFR